MEIDCLRNFDSKNTTLREIVSDSDSLVKNQSPSEISPKLSESSRDSPALVGH